MSKSSEEDLVLSVVSVASSLFSLYMFSEIVMTAMKKNGRAMMRLERKKKDDIDFSNIHHIAGGPYKGILVSKTADGG